MKTILYTGYDEAYKPLADLTVPLMAEYAERHGMKFFAYSIAPAHLNTYWTGVARGLELLIDDEPDRVIYLDVDQMVTNPDFLIDGHIFEHGFHVPRDWGNDAKEMDASACCLILYQDCIPLLEEILALEPEYRDKPFQEQAPMRQVLQQRMDTHPIYIHTRKPLNCVPDQVCPGKVPEPWQPGDFAAHITMVSLERRIEIFHELRNVHPGQEQQAGAGT
jgi:hypothetical protein